MIFYRSTHELINCCISFPLLVSSIDFIANLLTFFTICVASCISVEENYPRDRAANFYSSRKLKKCKMLQIIFCLTILFTVL